MADAVGAEDASTLAAEVFQVAGILRQGQDGTGGQYTFPLEDVEAADGGTFELARDDVHHLIGLLNSPEVDRSKAQLGSLLHNLPRPAVEGLTRRLFAALKSRSEEQANLQQQALATSPGAGSRGGSGRPPSFPGGRQTRSQPKLGASPRSGTSQQRGSYFGMYPDAEDPSGGAAARVQVAEEPPSPKRGGTYYGTYACPEEATAQSLRSNVQPIVRQVSRERPFQPRARTRSPEGDASAAAQQRAMRSDGPMPEVFQRLYHGDVTGHAVSRSPRGDRIIDEVRAPSLYGQNGSHSYDQVHRAQLVAEASADGGPEISYGPPGLQENEQAPLVSDYLSSLLQQRENETGLPASASRRSPLEDMDPQSFVQPARVPEEKAKEIFDRLYKSGQELRCRRTVYSRLGELVQEAKNAQTCTFEPRVPLAQYRGGAPSQGTVFDRLHQDMNDRTKRRDQLLRQNPGPSFRPKTNDTMRRDVEQSTPGLSPRDTLQVDDGGAEDGNEDGQGMAQEESQMPMMGGGLRASPHNRLYNEHKARQQRKQAQSGSLVKWKEDFHKKHPFKPDLMKSKMSYTPSSLLGEDVEAYCADPQEADLGGQDPGDWGRVVSVPASIPSPRGGSVEAGPASLEGASSIAASAAAAFAGSANASPLESPRVGGAQEESGAAEAVMSALVEDAARNLPDGPRVVILGGNKFRNEDTEILVQAVARRFASHLGGRVSVLTGGQPGAQEVFARGLGSQFQNLINLVPEYASDSLVPYGLGRDVICGENIQERMQVLSQVGDIYLSFEGGPNIAATMRTVAERGAVVVPFISTGGASAGLFESFPRSFMVRPPFATKAQWQALGGDEGRGRPPATPRAAVAPEVAAAACVEIVAGYLSQLRGGAELVPSGQSSALASPRGQATAEATAAPSGQPSALASPRQAGISLTPRSSAPTASPRPHLQAAILPAMGGGAPPPLVAPQPVGVDSIGGASQTGGTPRGGSVVSTGAAPSPANSYSPTHAYGVPAKVAAMQAQPAQQDPFTASLAGRPVRLASMGSGVGGSTPGGSTRAGVLGQVPLSSGGGAPVLSARMASAPQSMGYAGGWVGSSSTGALPAVGASMGRAAVPYGGGQAAPWGQAVPSPRGGAVVMR